MGQRVAVCVTGVRERAFRRGFGDSRSRLSVGAVVCRAAPIAHPEPLLISRINFGNTRPSDTEVVTKTTSGERSINGKMRLGCEG